MLTETLNWAREILSQLDLYLDGRINFWLMMIGLSSALMFVGSVLVTIVLLARLPADHFLTWHLPREEGGWHWAVHAFRKLVKNLLGLILLLIGLVMLFLPGQGMLTILIALMILDFPYKKTILDQLVAKPRVQASLNWIRKRRGKENFYFSMENAYDSSDRGSNEPDKKNS